MRFAELRSSIPPRRSFTPYLWILAVGSFTRALFLISLKPIWVPDSLSYTSACSLWAAHFFTDGARTPLYPLFLGFAQTLAGVPAISSLHPTAGYLVIAFQVGFGLISSCLIFATLENLGIRRSIALTAAIAFACCYPVCLYEQIILTESLATLAAALVLWSTTHTVKRLMKDAPSSASAAVTGLFAACAVLVRPDLLILALSVPAFFLISAVKIYFAPERSLLPGRLTKAAITFAVAFLPLPLVWMTINYIGVQQFRLTTSTGWQMSQAVYNLWDKVPPEDHLLGEILSRSYSRRGENNRGDRRDHFWIAFDELTTRSHELPLDNSRSNPPSSSLGRWLYELAPRYTRYYTHKFSAGAVMRPSTSVETPNAVGDYIGQVSWKLMGRYPKIWLHNAWTDFLFTFDFRSYKPSDEGASAVPGGSLVRHPRLLNLTFRLANFEAPLLTSLYTLTLLIAILSPLVFFRLTSTSLSLAAVTAFAVATLATMTAYALLAGYDQRYGVPHIATLFLCGATAAELTLRFLTARHPGHSQARHARSQG